MSSNFSIFGASSFLFSRSHKWHTAVFFPTPRFYVSFGRLGIFVSFCLGFVLKSGILLIFRDLNISQTPILCYGMIKSTFETSREREIWINLMTNFLVKPVLVHPLTSIISNQETFQVPRLVQRWHWNKVHTLDLVINFLTSGNEVFKTPTDDEVIR